MERHRAKANHTMPHRRIPAIAAASMLLVASHVEADYVILKNGNRRTGLVTAETGQIVRFKTTDGLELVLDRSKISHLEIQPRADNLLLAGTFALRKPDFLEAANTLKQSLDAGADAASVRRTVIESSPRFLDRMVYMSKTEKGVWQELCDRLSSEDPNDGDWTYLRGEMALVTGDRAAAIHAWQSLDSDYYAAHEQHRKRVTQWAMRELQKVIEERRFQDSVTLVHLLGRLDIERARAHSVVVKLGMAEEAFMRNDLGEACRIYAQEVLPLSPEVAKVCLRRSLEPYCRSLWQRGMFSEALRVLDEYALPFLPKVGPQLAAETYRQYIRRTIADGNWAKARGLLAEGNEFFTPDEAAQLNREILYGERRGHLVDDNYVGHYKLGIELQNEKMYGAAMAAFERAARSPQPELQEMARERMAMVRESQALEMREEIKQKMDEHRYFDVLDMTSAFERTFRESKYASQVGMLAKTAHQEMTDEESKSENLAAIWIDQAQRLFYLDKVSEALELVDRLLKNYPNSEVAPRAQLLKQDILRRQAMEGVAPRPADSKAPDSARARPTLPGIGASLFDQLDEDAFKREIEAIKEQLTF